MITLTFNSTAKTVRITREGFLTEYQDVQTVKVREGFYEIMQRQGTVTESQIPVCRLPIANTIMFIDK
jgi:hypothetical protein